MINLIRHLALLDRAILHWERVIKNDPTKADEAASNLTQAQFDFNLLVSQLSNCP